jgi:prophage regulatory protein
MGDKILRFPQLREIIPVTNVTLWRWEKAGKFPKRVQLGGNSAGWLEKEVNEWIEQRAKERNGG